jgi:hypothetical protein
MPRLPSVQPSQRRPRLGVVVTMASSRPPAPNPDWSRMDQRGPLSTRYAWGYMSPDESVLVTDEGAVYVRVDTTRIEHDARTKTSIVLVSGKVRSALRRAIDWAKVVKQLWTFEEDVEDLHDEAEDEVFMAEPAPPEPNRPERNLRLKPPKRDGRYKQLTRRCD